jgi:hypothetical protein
LDLASKWLLSDECRKRRPRKLDSRSWLHSSGRKTPL